MTWVKLDDAVSMHPKLRKAGGEAAWLWVCGLALCNRDKNGGLIKHGDLPALYPGGGWGKRKLRSLATKLVEAGLWTEVAEGFRVHDYDDYQPAVMKPERTDEDRRKDRERQAKHRAKLAAESAPEQTPRESQPNAARIPPESGANPISHSSGNETGYGPKSTEPVDVSRRDTRDPSRARVIPVPVPVPEEEREESAGACPPGVDPHAWRFAEHLKTKPLIADALGSEDVVAKASEWLGLTLMSDWGVAAAIAAVDSEHKTLRAEDTPGYRLRAVTRCLERLQRDARSPEKRRKLMTGARSEAAGEKTVVPPQRPSNGDLTVEQKRAVAAAHDITGSVLGLLKLQGEALVGDRPASFEEFKQRRAELAERMRGARDVPA